MTSTSLPAAVALAFLAFLPPARAQSNLDLYTDSLGAGWADWSWAKVTVGDPTYAKAGSKSIKVLVTAPWQALYLHHDALSTVGYTHLDFWIHGGPGGGQKLRVIGLLGGKEQTAVPLAPLPANTWQHLSLSLASLGLDHAANFDGLWVADATGTALAAFYLDEVRLLAGTTPPVTPTAVAIGVDAARNTHVIDARIYGVAFASPAELNQLNVPLNRSGGNNTTRYNWKANALNLDADWFYESIPGDHGAAPGADGDAFVADSRAGGAEPMLTLPLLGWVAKLGPNRTRLWSYSIAKYGAQTKRDPYLADAGNGLRASDGAAITTNDPNDANLSVGPDYQTDWVRHLLTRWGDAAHGGVRYYLLDNEPSLWHSTHQDVHPNGATMEEVRDKFLALAEQVKAVDPEALVVGPEDWGWLGLLYSGADQQYAARHNNWSVFPDRAAHGGQDFLPWFLDQVRQRGTVVNRRLLDVVTTHFYPAGVDQDDVSAAAQRRRNRSTRALWDPTYRDESWVDAVVNLIPRLKGWVQTHYPGTQIGITEYNWGWAESHMNAATAQADLLGIFGREGLDLATRWTTPATNSPVFRAIQLYRNYDGRKSTFGETSVAATVPNPDDVAAFAATRAADGALTVMVVNKQLTTPADARITVAGFADRGTAELWQLSGPAGIQRLPDVPLTNHVIATVLPAQSVNLLVLPGAPNAPRLRFDRLNAGLVHLQVEGQIGRSYLIQTSTNLTRWQDAITVTATAVPEPVTLPAGPGPAQFLRAVVRP